jgi:hypothetical protein
VGKATRQPWRTKGILRRLVDEFRRRTAIFHLANLFFAARARLSNLRKRALSAGESFFPDLTFARVFAISDFAISEQ